MDTTMKKRWIALAVAMIAVLGLSCSSELADSASPVHLLVTNTQNLQQIDLDPEATGCDEPAGTINMQAIAKNDTVSGPFTQVRITRYKVSYVRTDGGRTVPASFVRSIDTLLAVGAPATGSAFLVIQPDALNQAPFVSLLPNNGGRDPDTGRPEVQMDVIVEVFGETLAGDNVYGATRFPLIFCFDCNGCL
jgi:hypothetical protein